MPAALATFKVDPATGQINVVAQTRNKNFIGVHEVMIQGEVDFTGVNPQTVDSPTFTITVVGNGCDFCPANHLLPIDETAGDIMPEDMHIEIDGDDKSTSFSQFKDSFSLTCESNSCGVVKHELALLDGSAPPFDHELYTETNNLVTLTAWSKDAVHDGQSYDVVVRAILTRPDGTTEHLSTSTFVISFSLHE